MKRTLELAKPTLLIAVVLLVGVTSPPALLAQSIPGSLSPYSTLIDINFGAHHSPGLDANKVGLAATGLTVNDFWNFYSRDDGQGHWRVNGALPNLRFADGSASSAGLIVSNAPGCWADGSSDAMYNTYVYPFDGGNTTVTVTNLAAGHYDLYVYGPNGNFQLTVGGTSYGARTSFDWPVINPTVWQEGRQYAVYRGVRVGAAQAVTLTVLPNACGYLGISGMQIASAGGVANVPSILAQPQSQTARAGSSVTFTVAASGTPPLSYQWRLGETNLAGATGSALVLPNVQPPNAGRYSVRVSNLFGSVLSSNATLTVIPATAASLIDVNFGAHQSPGLDGIKVGLAATGQSTNDFWNFYSRDDGHGHWLVDGALPGLKFADGSVSAAGLMVSNAPGCWGDGSSDAMYNTYVYPFNGGNTTVMVTNLAAGKYDLYVYGPDGNYQLTVGPTNYGVKTTWDQPVINPPLWQEGRQYALYRGVSVGSGQGVILTVRPGVGGYAVISGMQIIAGTLVTGTPPSIVTQPQSQTVGVGTNVTFTVVATGTSPLSYQWRINGTNIPAATASALTLTNVQLVQARSYSVRVTNLYGSATSSNAVLTVNPAGACVPSPAGLVGWWRAEANAEDQAGTNNGTLVGNTAYGAGRVGQAFVFDGRGDAVSVGNPTNLQLQNFTIEAWIKRANRSLASFGGEGAGHIFGGSYGGYVFGLWDDGRLTLGQIGISGVESTRAITDTNGFHHVAVTKNGSNIVFYVDGAGETAAAYNPGFVFGGGFAIGARGGDYGASFLGSLDEVSFYNRPLTAAEIQAIYSAGGAGKCTGATAPFINSQPASQTVSMGGTATFTVMAGGQAPLSYQWRLGGTNLAGATISSLVLANVQPANAGNYSVRVTNAFGSMLSSNALLTVIQATPQTLINVDFGAGPATSGSPKAGPAAVGQATNDFWNFYTRDDDSGGWRTFGVLANLKFANGAVSSCGMTVLNAPGAWGDGSSDPMYDSYIYPFDGGNVTVTVTNLIAGQYDFHVYGPDGNYQLTVGLTDYGVKTAVDQPVINPPVWQEGRQYALYRGVSVGAGQVVSLTVRPGVYGYAVISGMQIGAATVVTGTPPSILVQPRSQTVGAGSNVTFTGVATGTAPLSYQWRLGGTNLLGATGTWLTLQNVQPAAAGNYSVRVTNAFGSIVSSNATLTVTQAAPHTLINVDFGAGPASGGSPKAGVAAVGLGTNDFWNFYTRDDGFGGWRTFGVLSNLKFANGAVSTSGMTVLNAPGEWADGSSDPMYNSYIYPFDGSNVTVTVTNLAAGQYDFYVYGPDGNYQLGVGPTVYGVKTTLDQPLVNPPSWQEGRQYASYRGVSVGVGQGVILTVRPGMYGYAIISGMQIVSPVAVGQPRRPTAQLRLGSAPSIPGYPRVQLELVGDPNRVYAFQASTLLTEWVTIGLCVTDANGSVTLTDPDAGKYPARLYRVVAQ